MVRVTSVRSQRNTKRQIQLLVVVTSINATMNHRISFTQISFSLSLFMAQSTDLNTVAKSPKNNEKIFFPLERYGCSVGPLNLLDSTHNLARAFWPSREKRHKGKRKRGWELRGKKFIKSNQPCKYITFTWQWPYKKAKCMNDTFGFRSGPTTFLCQTASRSQKL